MTTPVSGIISINNVVTEFGGSAPHSLSEYYRGAGFVTSNNTNIPASGNLKLSNFYNAVKQFVVTITSNQTSPVNLRSYALSAGWNGNDNLLFVINSGVVVSSNTTATAALTISGSYPAGLILQNNGYIVGMGGAGGNQDAAGSPGGPAILVSSNVSIDNTGTIAGGGGGGGAGSSWSWNGFPRSSPGSGGASGLTQAAGGSGSMLNGYPSGGPNAQGLYNTGGASNNWGTGGRVSSPGGVGGSWGSSGDTGGGPDGAYNYTGYSGGAGGAAVQGNSFVTWQTTGTRYGSLV